MDVMRMDLGSIVVACALVVFLAPGDISAQSGSAQGSGAGQQSGEGAAEDQKPADTPPDAPPEATPPAPAGVGSAAPPKAEEGTTDDQKPPTPPPDASPEATPPSPAGVGSAAPPKTDESTESAEAADEAADKDVSDEGSQPQQPDETSGSVAQPSGRRFSGLFGGAAPFAGQGRRLDVSGSVSGVRLFDNNLPIVGSGTDVVVPRRTTYASAVARLVYGQFWENGSLGAAASFGESYIPAYKNGSDPWIERWSASVNGSFSKELGRKVRMATAARALYSPYLQQQNTFLNGPPTVVAPAPGTPGLDLVVARQPFVLMGGGGSLVYSLSRRSSIEFVGDLQTRVLTEGDQPSQLQVIGRGRYRYRFGRYVGVRAGYGLRYARYGLDEDLPGQKSHIIDVGLDGGYGRSYALTRQTTFAFNVGSNIVAIDEFRQGSSGQQGFSDQPSNQQFDPRARFVVSGSADLLHAWARTWSVNLGYRRGVSYEIGFEQPLISNSTFSSLGGLLAPRLDFTASAFYTRGSAGFTGRNNGYGTASASVSLRTAVTTNLAAYAQYFYYQYLFEPGVSLPSYLPPSLARQGVIVGLTVWVPLISSRGRP